MGTRINALMDHDLADFRDPAECLARLATATPAGVAVHAYWRAAEPESPHDEPSPWQAEPVTPRSHDLRRFTGPGSLFLTVTAEAARVRTGGRWRGFLAIEPLRRVHLVAFRAIAWTLGAGRMAVYPDSDEIDGLFWDGYTLRECVQRMQRRWGAPQESIEQIDPGIVAAAELYLPSPVWFVVDVQGGA
jgi:hypothetical protein